MVEVEIRGQLNPEELLRLSALLEREGVLIEDQDREMILLRGYPGYSADPIVREVDIRLRSTNGFAEIMLKQKTSDHNVARREVSLPLAVSDLVLAKEVLKALGHAEGIWMHRKKKVYSYRDIEWSLVEVPQNLSYFEAEQEVHENEDVERVRIHLESEARKLDLTPLGPEEMRTFIAELDSKVNKDISW